MKEVLLEKADTSKMLLFWVKVKKLQHQLSQAWSQCKQIPAKLRQARNKSNSGLLQYLLLHQTVWYSSEGGYLMLFLWPFL